MLNVKGENCQEVRLEGLRWACKALHTTPKRLGFVLWVLEPVEGGGESFLAFHFREITW